MSKLDKKEISKMIKDKDSLPMYDIINNTIILIPESKIYYNFNKNYLRIKDQRVRIISAVEPGTIPWDALQADVVIDATGKFLTHEKLALHLKSGAKRVFLTRNPKNDIDRCVIPGVNDSSISLSDKIISTTSSTTQVLALMMKMLVDLLLEKHIQVLCLLQM